MNASFEKLAMRNGGYSLPYLIHLHDINDEMHVYFINDTKNIMYNGNQYNAACFKYVPSDAVAGFNGGGTLNISAVDKYGLPNDVVIMCRKYKELKLEVVGVILDDKISPISKYQHHYGSVSTKQMEISFTFDADDRSQMTFPALIWNNSNNRG